MQFVVAMRRTFDFAPPTDRSRGVSILNSARRVLGTIMLHPAFAFHRSMPIPSLRGTTMTMRSPSLLIALALTAMTASALARAPAHESPASPGLTSELPAPPRPRWSTVPGPPEAREMVPGGAVAIAPGVDGKTGRVVLHATALFDQGPVDGLEVQICLEGGKTHEALFRVDTANGTLVKAAFIAALGVPDGLGSAEDSGLPVRGVPLAVTVFWQDVVAKEWRATPLSTLVRDRRTDRPVPALPYIYTGSRMVTTQAIGADGQPTKRERFMLDVTKSVAVNYNEPDALVSSAFPEAGEDIRWETNSALAPATGTKVQIAFERVALPLVLDQGADGGLGRNGATLDDAAIDRLLAEHYGEGVKPALRAVEVRVKSDTGRDQDAAARARLLKAAARAKAWVVPVFVPVVPATTSAK